MVEADVGQHRDLRPIERDRAVAFVHLADEQLGVADQCAREGRGRSDEIAHHRAVHHCRLAMARVKDPADHAGHGRLAARAGDGDGAARAGEESEVVGAVHDLRAELLGAHDVLVVALDGG